LKICCRDALPKPEQAHNLISHCTSQASNSVLMKEKKRKEKKKWYFSAIITGEPLRQQPVSVMTHHAHAACTGA